MVAMIAIVSTTAATMPVAAAAATGNTLLDEQFCQVYYTLNDKDCSALRSRVRSEVRGKHYKTPTLEMGDPKTQPAMVFLHGWPDTAAIWANQFAEFCGDDKYYCVAPSWIDYHPDYPSRVESLPSPTWKDQVDAFKDVIDDLGLTDITLVAFDFGAYMSYQMLHYWPDLAKVHIALDIGMKVGHNIAPVPFDGRKDVIPIYQQNNIDAFLEKNDQAMTTNLETRLGGKAPCHNCKIAPNATAGSIGARTGWPYYNFVRTDKPWTNFFSDVPFDEWQFDYSPSYPKNLPLLFLYSSTMFHDESFRHWIDDRAKTDKLSEHQQMEGTDHWIPTRVPKALNDKMTEWLEKASVAEEKAKANNGEL